MAQSTLWYLTRGGLGAGAGGGDESWGVDVDSAGNIYWATCEKPAGGGYFNIILYKIDSSGQEIYASAPFGGQWNEKAFMAKVNSNTVYLGGRQDTTWWPTSANALVLAYDITNGNYLWQYTWDGGYGYEEIDGLVPESDGIYLSGWTTGQSTSNDFLIQKIDYSGQQVWNNPWGTTMWDDANGHMVVDDTRIFIAGRDSATGQLSNDGDAILTCFDRTTGNFLWRKSWGGTGIDDYFGMTASSDSFLYAVGFTTGFSNGSQIFIHKYTKAGVLLWSRIWGGSGAESSRAIIADGDSIIFIAGKTTSYGSGDNDILLLKYDSSGNLLDSLIWGGVGYEVAHDMVMYGDYIYLCGETGSFGTQNTQNDALLLKINGRIMQTPDTTITAVPFISDESSVKIFPNPFSDYTTVHLKIRNEDMKEVSIRIFDVYGRKVDADMIRKANSFVISVGDLFAGIYFLKLKSKKLSAIRKIIIVK
ncbi:MAG: T9SS type A sorting domain-containing protein [Bacteroidetes bacterium]|nr:T9SS type A sorting domain-containing protein [Bacteroidota bacterium]